MQQELFGHLVDGRPVTRWRWQNSCGLELSVLDLGGIISELWVPDREGLMADIVLGFDHPQAYLDDNSYFGALIGRCANRIAHGKFELDGVIYDVPRNSNGHTLHGGFSGFHGVFWDVEPLAEEGTMGLRLTRQFADGEEGFPGNLSVTVEYWLSDQNELTLNYTATTDAPTIVNICQHSYFNLAGHNAGSVSDHSIQCAADRFTPVGVDLIPTGDILSVQGTPLDMQAPRSLGFINEAADDVLTVAGGLDHNMVFPDDGAGSIREVARVSEPISDRSLRVFTDQPGMQLYTANHLDGSLMGKGGTVYQQHAGVALETQHFPDSPNQPTFPSTVLRPGNVYRSTTVYAFNA